MPSLFAEFAPVPLASASVSQVHKARLPDGRVVAVKVRRPDVVELCTFDLAVMRIGARCWRYPLHRDLAPVAIVEEFGRAIFAQLDFTIEAANNRRFRQNFAGHTEVVFPELVEALCSERVLTMSFVEGTKILDARARGPTPSGSRAWGCPTLLKMIFEDGFVHADLHPGNIFITPDDKLALLDLGLVGDLDEPHRKAFARFFAAWAQRDGDAMAHIMYEHLRRAPTEPRRSRGVRALPGGHHRVRGALLGPAPGRGAGRQGAARPAGDPSAPPRPREPQLHHREHRDRRHRGHRQAARSRAGPDERSPALSSWPTRSRTAGQRLTRKSYAAHA